MPNSAILLAGGSGSRMRGKVKDKVLEPLCGLPVILHSFKAFLDSGEISEVIEMDSGYHLIRCVSTFDREETDANKLKIVEERRAEVFGQEYDAFVETLVRSLNESLWQEITMVHNAEVQTDDFFAVYEQYKQ